MFRHGNTVTLMSTTETSNTRALLVEELKKASDKNAHLETLWKTAAEKKSAETCEFLAAVYASGIEEMKIPKDEKKFEDALAKGTALGSTTCMIAQGERETEATKAAALFVAALEAKDYRAANALGVMALRSGDLGDAIAKFELAESHKVERASQNLLISRMQASLVSMQRSMGFLQKAMSVFMTKTPPAAAAAAEKKDDEKKN